MEKKLLSIITVFGLIASAAGCGLKEPYSHSYSTHSCAVYLGVEGYGTKDAGNKDSLRYRFFADGGEYTYAMYNSGGDYELQNKLKEGYIYDIAVSDDTVTELDETDYDHNTIASGVVTELDGDTVAIGDNRYTLDSNKPVWRIIPNAGSADIEEASIHVGDTVFAPRRDDNSLVFVYILPRFEEYTPPVTGTAGLKTLKNFISTSLTPVGTTLYVYGGGWNWQDSGSAPQATSIGLAREWVGFFQLNDKSYTYKDKDDKEIKRDASRSYYPFGGWNEYYYAGADCSGFIGWVLYNTMNTSGGGEGFVFPADKTASKLAARGWGSVTQDLSGGTRAGDIISIGTHVWLSLGDCSDGSTVIIHCTPNPSRAGQPGGGVQLGAIGESESCEAYRLADKYMSEFFPKWYERYPAALKDARIYFDFSKAGTGIFRWNFTGENGGLTDPDGYTNMSPAEILEDLF